MKIKIQLTKDERAKLGAWTRGEERLIDAVRLVWHTDHIIANMFGKKADVQVIIEPATHHPYTAIYPPSDDWNERVKHLRSSLVIPQRQMAILYRTTDATISDWELRRFRVPGSAQILTEIYESGVVPYPSFIY